MTVPAAAAAICGRGPPKLPCSLDRMTRPRGHWVYGFMWRTCDLLFRFWFRRTQTNVCIFLKH